MPDHSARGPCVLDKRDPVEKGFAIKRWLARELLTKAVARQENVDELVTRLSARLSYEALRFGRAMTVRFVSDLAFVIDKTSKTSSGGERAYVRGKSHLQITDRCVRKRSRGRGHYESFTKSVSQRAGRADRRLRFQERHGVILGMFRSLSSSYSAHVSTRNCPRAWIDIQIDLRSAPNSI